MSGDSDSVYYLVLVSSDGERIEISRKVACQMGMLREMIDIFGEEAVLKGDPIPIPNVEADILRTVVEMCAIHDSETPYVQYERARVPYQPRLEFMDMAMEMTALKRTRLLNAANFLNVPLITDAILAYVAKKLYRYSVKQMRKALNITNDFSPAEEEENAREFPFYND